MHVLGIGDHEWFRYMYRKQLGLSVLGDQVTRKTFVAFPVAFASLSSNLSDALSLHPFIS